MIQFLTVFHNKKHSLQTNLNAAFSLRNLSYREKTWQSATSFWDSSKINLKVFQTDLLIAH